MSHKLHINYHILIQKSFSIHLQDVAIYAIVDYKVIMELNGTPHVVFGCKVNICKDQWIND